MSPEDAEEVRDAMAAYADGMLALLSVEFGIPLPDLRQYYRMPILPERD